MMVRLALAPGLNWLDRTVWCKDAVSICLATSHHIYTFEPVIAFASNLDTLDALLAPSPRTSTLPTTGCTTPLPLFKMAEGTYGSPYYQQIVSPTEPSTPAAKFATSVTRKKTRKWVEAKKINYDGSGWGDDDDDDDDEYEDDAAALPMPAGSSAQSAPRALPSQQSSLPSAALLSRNPSPHPSLHLQTEQQPPASSLPSQSLPSQSLPSQQPWRQGSPAPSSTRDSSPGISSPRSGALPTWRDGRSESPLGPRGQSPANSAGPNGPRAFIRPSDIYKRAIGQDEPPVKKTAEKAAELPAPASPAPAPVELPAADVEPEHKDVPPPIAKYAEPVAAPSPQPTTQRKALNVANPTPTPPPAPAPVVETVIEVPAITAESATAAATDANGERRFSSSPKLPDLARFSMFSPDLLFGGSNFLASDNPPVPSMPNSPATASFPGQAAGAKDAAPVVAPQTKLASVVEDVDRASGTASPFSTSSIKSGSALRDSAATAATATTTATADGPHEIAQGNVSSAVDSGKSTPAAEPETGRALNVKEEPAEAVATASPDYSAADQVAPLKPNRASQLFLPSVSLPVAPMGPRVMERTGTADTVSASVTSSPVKESDVLREEIIRTLSPVKSAQSDLSQDQDQDQKTYEANDNTTATMHDGASTATLAKSTSSRSAEPTRTLTRDSSYLQDVYDDYWTPDDASGHEAYTPPPVPPLSTANTAAASAPVAVPAITASPEMASASPYNLPSQTQQVPPLAKSPSPAPAPAIAPAPSAIPASISSVPGTRSSSLVVAPNLRRRFSWEAEPESSPSPVMASVAPAPAVQAIQPGQSTSPAPSAGAVATPPAMQGRSSPGFDPKASLSAVSVLSASQDPIASPSPLSEAPASATSPSHADSATERPVTQTQAPIRSMLDVGDEKPAVRSMLDIDDVPATPAAPAGLAAPVSPVEDETTPITIAAAVAAGGAATAGVTAAVAANRASGTDSMHSARSAQSVQSPLQAAPSSAQSNQASLGGANPANPAIYGSGSEGTAQFLTLRQCMAFGSHSERMAKLTETRREYALADSGLSGWLTHMTVIPEYSRASYVPLWDGPLTVPPPSSRPAAAAVAAIAHVPHVNISSSQISNKSKEIFGVAAGKAGKGFLALRKKGFHKKSAN
ncbi:hypothetical protein F503_04929 [Ophiostoma piceae UAMH 11346]|uniref:Uncharacterized protein n=1 Tax=Ophiostoma piceae (strain UAMH 11346) TaxID=1262450 RepID=S3BX93_OPHP1|nr:hypothetical protein F503_04929 [Ophiostoma piceae UAMH 11346]